MSAFVIKTPAGVTRLLQPAGGRDTPARWRHGFALRLTGRHLLLVAF